MAGAAASELSRGGMRTKLDAGKIATTAGTAMIIASGQRDHPLASIEGGALHTLFKASANPVTGYKTWIAGNLEPAGHLTIDAGALKALIDGKSLLAAGVRKVQGAFARGDTVAVLEKPGVKWRAALLPMMRRRPNAIAGMKSAEIEQALGHAARSAMIHRDDLVVTSR